DYESLTVVGPRADQVVAFRRRHQGYGLIVIAGRFFARLVGKNTRYDARAWKDTALVLPAGSERLVDALTGEDLSGAGASSPLSLAVALGSVPVAVLIGR